ncbi:hypothetical protein F5Y09DRAFT_183177 [Xylaria sp. FL1042]|nr:hypothetical protein F5Y09DRAFT_183177 [Xylaria sp. FL1042]
MIALDLRLRLALESTRGGQEALLACILPVSCLSPFSPVLSLYPFRVSMWLFSLVCIYLSSTVEMKWYRIYASRTRSRISLGAFDRGGAGYYCAPASSLSFVCWTGKLPLFDPAYFAHALVYSKTCPTLMATDIPRPNTIRSLDNVLSRSSPNIASQPGPSRKYYQTGPFPQFRQSTN